MNALSEIVIAKRNERGLSQRALAVKSKINNATISRIEKGEGDPNPDTLRKLAVALGISVDTLFEACGYAEKRTLGEGLEYMFPEQSLIEKIISTLPLINTPVSAGSGAWLADGHEYELCEFEDAPDDANFALRVRGDSMSPMYNDDDIVYVKTCVQVEGGQIGVFYLNGEGYMKMLQGNKLVSLNSSYAPVQIGEFDEFFVAGRIVGKA